MRPDINARYNMGGWPTTYILNPAGEVLAGGISAGVSALVGSGGASHREDRDKVEAVWRNCRRNMMRAGTARRIP